MYVRCGTIFIVCYRSTYGKGFKWQGKHIEVPGSRQKSGRCGESKVGSEGGNNDSEG